MCQKQLFFYSGMANDAYSVKFNNIALDCEGNCLYKQNSSNAVFVVDLFCIDQLVSPNRIVCVLELTVLTKHCLIVNKSSGLHTSSCDVTPSNILSACQVSQVVISGSMKANKTRSHRHNVREMLPTCTRVVGN